METSPFSFGQVVHQDAFTNRNDEKKMLKGALSSGNSMILISPRRIGKSSLVKQVFEELGKDKGLIPISLDITFYRTEEQFLEDFANKLIQATTSKLKSWASTLAGKLKYLVPTIQYSASNQEQLSFSFNWTEQKKTKEEILKLPELLSKENGKKIIIAIDEFQNIGRFDNSEALQFELRSFWQHQKNTSYCLYGSKRHMMEEIFSSGSAPLYNFGIIHKLKRIQEQHWTPFLTEKFEKTGKTISKKYAETISQWAQNHSEQVQFLAHFIWTASSRSKKINQSHMVNGMINYLNATHTPSTDLFDKLSIIQINLLRAILNEEKQLTARETLNKYGLKTSATALKAKKALIKEDLLEQLGANKYRIINPAFEYWFRKKVLQEDIVLMYRKMLE